MKNIQWKKQKEKVKNTQNCKHDDAGKLPI